eukprot:4306071-Prorocentrum_lima.AAC.1
MRDTEDLVLQINNLREEQIRKHRNKDTFTHLNREKHSRTNNTLVTPTQVKHQLQLFMLKSVKSITKDNPGKHLMDKAKLSTAEL